MFPLLLLSRFISRWITCTGNKKKVVVIGSVAPLCYILLKTKWNKRCRGHDIIRDENTSVSVNWDSPPEESFVIGAASLRVDPGTFMGCNLDKPICSIHPLTMTFPLHILRHIYDSAIDVGYFATGNIKR